MKINRFFAPSLRPALDLQQVWRLSSRTLAFAHMVASAFVDGVAALLEDGQDDSQTSAQHLLEGQQCKAASRPRPPSRPSQTSVSSAKQRVDLDRQVAHLKQASPVQSSEPTSTPSWPISNKRRLKQLVTLATVIAQIAAQQARARGQEGSPWAAILPNSLEHRCIHSFSLRCYASVSMSIRTKLPVQPPLLEHSSVEARARERLEHEKQCARGFYDD